MSYTAPPDVPWSTDADGGQALVEFAILIPILFVLIMGLIEFAVAFNATLSVNRASQNAAHTASIAASTTDVDGSAAFATSADFAIAVRKRCRSPSS